MKNNPPIPRLTSPFTPIYIPGPDVFTLPTVTSRRGPFTYRQGETYPKWAVNDHAFLKDRGGRWHCFGITKPADEGDLYHAGEGLCFHALAPVGPFRDGLTWGAWADRPKIHVGDCGWAPAGIDRGDHYLLIGSHLGVVRSGDLDQWEDQGVLDAGSLNKPRARDPYVFTWKGVHHLYRCGGNHIEVVTSTDWIHWTPPVMVYQGKVPTYQCESPAVIERSGFFYLFWTLWDEGDQSTYGYCPRTYLHVATSPVDFLNAPMMAEYTVHAPEIITDERGDSFMSSAHFPHRGISVASFDWV